MKKTQIVDMTLKGDAGQAVFGTSTRNTGLSQRETLEEIIINLATRLGIKTVEKRLSARGSEFYSTGGLHQSATNTVLELSRLLVAETRGDAKHRSD